MTTNETKRLSSAFGTLMRRKRNEKRMTQQMLADALGISCTYLRDLEHGVHTMTWQNWLRTCTILDINVNHFQKEHIQPHSIVS